MYLLWRQRDAAKMVSPKEASRKDASPTAASPKLGGVEGDGEVGGARDGEREGELVVAASRWRRGTSEGGGGEEGGEGDGEDPRGEV